MNNSAFYMPTKIIIGKNAINDNKNLLINIGTKALIVTGRNSSKKNGSLNDVEKTLKGLNLPYVIFNEVEENPSLETVEKIAILGKEEKADFIIGIGGGSPIDASKAAGVLIKNINSSLKDLSNSPLLDSIPIIAVPTTAGTGTETTPYAIVTDHELKTKKGICQRIFPTLAFLDATYLMNTPKEVTMNTCIDALSHLIEGYLSTNANFFSDLLAEKAMELFGQCIQSLRSNEINFEIREKLLVASTIAGMVISQTGTSLPHGMGYALTYFKNVPHGKANGILLKSYLDFCNDKRKVNKIISLLNFNNLNELGEFLIEVLGKPMINITEEEISNYSSSMASNAAKLKNHPDKVSKEDILRIYNESLK
ncbi:MAG: iron-containing alcohol dehydrogenase [Clostridium argentinense]|uniref:Iron-containing alcohol dehydrogenase n=1 Tax=Clostridium faecium TaxID=2762223 RepID=A0ABR8YWY0_9CLOT|nr:MULTISPECIES: iron-containing alcohol dehydrogenase family protein [Clostridium]MBD8048783.1 iron-containing alcohol dehydrogenase [Clostridium faecium]MBS5824098.1 iron-containing alcohol dehydrogenase [Clostridium argentinense]MDU1350195.1 iron-containing alcohol dehydrogenase family protein [Clostridium argentinense]